MAIDPEINRLMAEVERLKEEVIVTKEAGIRLSNNLVEEGNAKINQLRAELDLSNNLGLGEKAVNVKLREALESIKVDVEIRTDFSMNTLRKVVLRYIDEALKDNG